MNRHGEAFMGIALLAQRLGVSVKDLPAPWLCHVDSRWQLVINGRGEDATAFRSYRIPPHSALAIRDGEVVGVVGLVVSLMVAGAEEELIEALEQRLSAFAPYGFSGAL